MSEKKLNLGSGAFPKAGFVNVDGCARFDPDIVHDLNRYPYPFRDDEVDLIEADHVLEHLEDPFRAMAELHRVLSSGGALIVRVPHFSRGFTHADHRRGFDVSFPYYFQRGFTAGYTGTDFKLQRIRMRWFGQPYFKRTVMPSFVYYALRSFGAVVDSLATLSPFLCSRIWCFWVGGFDEIEFRFLCVKE